jgi:hypothetical protein
MPNRYADILAGLVARLKTVDGLAEVLDYQPRAITTWPLAYCLLNRGSVAAAGQISTRRMITLVRVVIPQQDESYSEPVLAQLLDDIINAIEADPRLGGAITSGMAIIPEVVGVWVEIGGTLYRGYDINVEAVYKPSYGG